MLRLLAIAAAIVYWTLPAGQAYAQSSEARATRTPLGVLLSGAVLNGPAASRTVTVSLDGAYRGYGLLILYLDHTNSTATDVQMACTTKPTATDTDAALQSCTVASGNCTSDDATWTKAVGASAAWPWRVDVGGYPGQVDCVLSGTAAGAGDLATVKGWLVTQ